MAQVDRSEGLVGNTAFKAPVLAATTAAITLSGEQTIDGVSCVTGDRVLVKDQADTTTNGIYVVSTGSWNRSDDFDGAYDIATGTVITVTSGSQNGDTIWRISSTTNLIGTSSILFENAVFSDSASVQYLPSGTGAVATTVQAKLRLTVHLSDFLPIGYVTDASVNYRAELVAAVLAARGGKLLIPEGQFLINTNGGSITLEEISLIGEGVLDGATASLDQGSVLHFTGTTNSPFKIRRGVTFDGIGLYYPNQTDSATPTAYPPTLDFDFTNGAVQFVYIRDCVVYNAYRFCRIDDAGGAVGHVWVTDNTIYGISTCFEITNNAEVIKIQGNSFTFGHWLAATEAGCRGYTRANGIVLQYARGDGIFFNSNMIYGYLDALKVAGTNTVSLCRISSNTFDQCRYGIHATGSGNFTGSQIVGNDFNGFNSQDHTLQGNAIRIDTSGATGETLTISSNSFATCTEDSIYISGNTPTRNLNISNNLFSGWAAYKAAGNYAAINANGNNTNIHVIGNTIAGSATAYTSGILGSFNVGTINSNIFLSCNNAMNLSASAITHVGNVSYSTVSATTDNITATTKWSVGNNYDKASGVTTRCAFRVLKDAAQTTSGTTPLTVTFVTENYDLGGNWSSPTFTAPKTGRYIFEWALMHDNTGTAGDRFTIALTTSATGTNAISYKMIADYNSVSGSGSFKMTEGDTMTMIITRVSGSGVFQTHNDANYNYLCGSLVE